jgi:glycosyltransferase involved in cell wall biosynthesis
VLGPRCVGHPRKSWLADGHEHPFEPGSTVRVAIDVQNLLRPMTGVGHYVNNLVRALSLLPIDETIQAFYFSCGRTKQRLGLPPGKVVERAVKFPPGRVTQLLWKRFPFPRVDAFVPADLVHFPNFVARPVKSARVVVTIPDLSFMRFPQFTEPKNLSFLSRHVPSSLERADRIIAISEFTRKEIAELFPSSADKLVVTPLGVSELFAPKNDPQGLTRVRQKYNLPREYILFVGTLEPRKNLRILLEAYRILKRRLGKHQNMRLVVAGMKGWLYDETIRQIDAMPPDDKPLLIGYVEDAELPYLYSMSRMAVVPSLYEGFGLPCLEAMACGTPLVCSNTSSLPEVVGDAALMVSPTDAEEMADAMARVAPESSFAQELVRKGRKRAGEFTWRRCAQRTYKVYEDVASEHPRGSD